MSSKFYKIVFVGIISFIVANLLLTGIQVASNISSHPLISILMRCLFLVVIIISFVLKRKKWLIYFFIMCFPFMRIAFSGVPLIKLFASVFLIAYFREIKDLLSAKKNIFRMPFIIIGMSFIYTTAMAKFKYPAFEEITFYLALVVIFYVVTSYLRSEKEIKMISILLLVITIAGLLVSFIQLKYGINSIIFFFGEYNPNADIYGFSKRIPSFFNEAQAAGQFFAVMAILFLGLGNSFFKRSYFMKGIFVLSILALCLSITRIAFLAFLIGFIITLFSGKKTIKIIGFLGFCVFVLVSFPILKSIIPLQIQERFYSYSQHKSLDFRYQLWANSLPIFFHNPLGVGSGGDNIYVAATQQKVKMLSIFKEFPQTRRLTHFENSYLQILYSLGIIGLLGFFFIIGKYFIVGVRILKIMAKERIYNFSNYLLAAMVTWLISSFTSPQIREVQPMILFVILLSFMNSLNNLYSRNDQ
ncbi:MAG: O-antigen ligase family protein [Candidatus Omnitrophica bacterium]|nr:O-antigen ligase family protein [Candidatus Omnitrophota bacterium]